MVEQIKNKIILLTLVLFFWQSADAQKDTCVPISVIKDVELNNKDSIFFSLKNTGLTKIIYSLDVMVFNSNQWFYSDIFTMYFNRDMSYQKLYNLYYKNNETNLFPNYSVAINELKSQDTLTVNLPVLEQFKFKTLVKFRIHILDGKDNCDMLFSRPFYFAKIK